MLLYDSIGNHLLFFSLTLANQFHWLTEWTNRNHTDQLLLENFYQQDESVVLNSNIEVIKPLLNPIPICHLFEQFVCDKSEFSNLTSLSGIELANHDGLFAWPQLCNPFEQIDLSTVLVACKWVIKILTTLSRLVIRIAFRLLCWLIVNFFEQSYQLCVDLFVKQNLTTILTVLLIVLVAYHIRSSVTYWRRQNIPFESITAHLRSFSQTIVGFDDQARVQRYGKVFGSFRLTKPVLCVSDYRLIEKILFLNSDNFAHQKTWLLEGHLLVDSIFANSAPDINRWKRKKAILLSSFLSRKIKLLKPTVDNLLDEFVAYLKRTVSKPNPKPKSATRSVKLHDLTFPWINYSMLVLIFDIEVPKYGQFVARGQAGSKLIESSLKFMKVRNQIQRSALCQLLPRLTGLINLHLLNRSNRKQIQTVIKDAIKYRLDNGLLGLQIYETCTNIRKSVKFSDEIQSTLISSETDIAGKVDAKESTCKLNGHNRFQAKLKELTFIDIILNYEIEPDDKLKGYELTMQELLDNLTAFFAVSVSTLYETISATLFYLALYGDEQNLVRQEIVDNIGEHKANISWKSLRNLKYTEAFIKEVLRLNSPVDRIERVVTKNCSINLDNDQKLELNSGTLCSILVSAVHRDPDHYPEPNQFRPSRFYRPSQTPQLPDSPISFDDSNDHKKLLPSSFGNEKFLAFGLGSRTCIGFKFVLFYLKHFIANILLEFELKMDEKQTKRHLSQQQQYLSIEQIVSGKIELVPRT